MLYLFDLRGQLRLEGRRYWPAFLWRLLHRSQESRLRKLNAQIDNFYHKTAPTADERRLYLEASVEKRSYPIGEDGERFAEHPTRLGNTISAYETYSDTRYGLDAIFYWPRIWVNLSKELREELDNLQAMADCNVYSAFALASTGMLWAMYGLFSIGKGRLATIGLTVGTPQELLTVSLSRYLPSAPMCFLLSGFCILLGFAVYRLAVSANEQFGTVFMAVIDTHVQKVQSEYLDVEAIIKRVVGAARIHIPDEEKLETVRRYLQYFNIKIPGHLRAVPVPQVQAVLSEDTPPNLRSRSKAETLAAEVYQSASLTRALQATEGRAFPCRRSERQGRAGFALRALALLALRA